MQDRVKGPAIGLIVTGSLGLLAAGGSVAMTLVGGGFGQQEYAEGAGEIMKFFTSPAYSIGSGVISLCLSGFFIFAGLKMKNLESWTVSMLACVLAMIPCFGCCLTGIPFGIWGLIVLMKEDVKEAFQS